MATVVTNTKAAPALRGQSVWVTLSAAESLSAIPLLEEGQECSSGSSSAVGYIDYIDTYGHSFRIKPTNMNTQFNSDETATLAVDETITIQTP